MNTAINTSEQQAQIINQIQLLVKEIQKCAPHPDKPDQNGPLFLKSDPNHQLPAEYDGMLGSMVLESMLGLDFAAAAGEVAGSWLGSADMMIEAGSTYMEDRSSNRPFQVGHGRAIANDFNAIGSKGPEYQIMMNAYLADLPDRVRLETWLSHETRRLYSLWKNAPAPAPRMAA